MKAAATLDGIRRGVLALQEAKIKARHKARYFQPKIGRMMAAAMRERKT